jgi:hypothetical protein
MHNNHKYFAVSRGSPTFYYVRSGSTYSNSGGTIHSATRIIIHDLVNYTTQDYDVALIEVCITFNVSIYSEMCITYFLW